MSDKTGIEWTHATWNPVTGCTKVSPGCADCYAEAITLRVKRGGPFLPGKTTVRVHPERLEQPAQWRTRRMIFLNSMSDLFHEEVLFSFIKNVFDVMEACSWHIYQVLTKRPERMLEYAQSSYGAGEVAEPCLGWSFRGESGLGRPEGYDITPNPSGYTVSLM